MRCLHSWVYKDVIALLQLHVEVERSCECCSLIEDEYVEWNIYLA